MIAGIRNRDISEVLFYLLVALIALFAFVITLYPFLYILASSLSSGTAINRQEVWLWPVDITLTGYKTVLQNPDIWTAYGNTILYTVVGTFLSVVASVMAAYPLSRKTFCARRFLNFFIVLVMYFSAGLIPTYLLITSVGLYNNRWVMILPALLSSYNVMVCRSAFSAIPDEVMESASIDGANEIQILFRIAIRLITPTLAVITLYYAVGKWNEFFTALLYLSKKDLQPLQVLLRRVLIQASSEMMGDGGVTVDERSLASVQIRYVTIMVATIPILAIYPFLQKYFVKGVMLGAVKG